jgi:hypothetical protein
MDRRNASLAQAELCRVRAKADPERRAYWMAEAVKWQQRANDEVRVRPRSSARSKSLHARRGD